MQFVKLLATVHIRAAESENPPFFHEVDLKRCQLPETEEKLGEIMVKSYQEYKEFNHPTGTVDVYTPALTKLVVKAICEGKNRIPNGCCSKKDCPTNVFYDLLVKNLSEN